MKRKACRMLALLLACALVLACSACGKDDTNEFNSGAQPSTAQQQPGTSAPETDGAAGFSAALAQAAGFDMGAAAIGDIIAMLGEPELKDAQEYTSMTYAMAQYPFGVFEFEGAPGTEPVLSFVQMYGTYTGPCGFGFGKNIEQCANGAVAGSGDGLMSGNYEQPQIWFYGDESGEYGKFMVLDAEYVTSDSTDVYALEYRAAAGQGRTVTYTAYFGEDFMLTNYTLRYQ